MRIGLAYADLTEHGLEVVIKDGLVIAKFLDGMSIPVGEGLESLPVGNDEITKVA